MDVKDGLDIEPVFALSQALHDIEHDNESNLVDNVNKLRSVETQIIFEDFCRAIVGSREFSRLEHIIEISEAVNFKHSKKPLTVNETNTILDLAKHLIERINSLAVNNNYYSK